MLRKSIYILLGSVDRALSRENKIVIYCYHGIHTNHWVFNVSITQFQEQMSYLTQWGVPITLDDLEEYLTRGTPLPNKCFIITFDDGYKNIVKATGTAAKFGIKPAVFILANQQGADRTGLGTESKFLNTKDIKTLIEHGWTVGSHGLTHKKLNKLNDNELKKEIRDSKKIIEEKIKTQVKHFAYPHGKYNKKAIDSVEDSEYSMAFTLNDQLVNRQTDPVVIPRVGVMGTHSFAEFPYLSSPSVLAFRRFIKNTPLRRFAL